MGVVAYAVDPYKANPKRMLRHWTSGTASRYESLVVKTKDGWRIKHHVVISEGPVFPARGPMQAATQ